MIIPDMEGIRKFYYSSDRDTACFFVGREEVLDNINYAWQSRMKKWREGNDTAFSSTTRVVQGAPGAGKTSLGQHLKSSWAREENGNDNPIVVDLSTEALNNPLAVFKIITEVVSPKANEKLRTLQTTQRTTSGRFDKIVKAEHQHQSNRQERSDPPVEWNDL